MVVPALKMLTMIVFLVRFDRFILGFWLTYTLIWLIVFEPTDNH